MAKKILAILGIWIISSVLFGFFYIKSTPRERKNLNSSVIKSGYKAAKEPFKTIGINIAQITLNKTKQDTKPLIKKMYEFGATDVIITTKKNISPIKNTLQPIVIGGKTYKNKVECSIVSYTYKNKKYEVGTCK